MPTIEKMMVLSTAHLRPETVQEMEENIADREVGAAHEDWPLLLTYSEHDYGFYVWTRSEDMQNLLDEGSLPDDLSACLKIARKHNCEWIKFDCDQPADENEPPHYDW